MCFHCGSIYRTKFDNITNRKRNRRRQRQRDADSDRNSQKQTEIDTEIDRNKDWGRPKAEKTEKWTDRLDEDCIVRSTM